MTEANDTQPPTDSPKRLPASAGGDMQDITAELNRLRDLLQRTHYRLIGKHGWGDPEATLIGDAMGWDSGSQNSEYSDQIS